MGKCWCSVYVFILCHAQYTVLLHVQHYCMTWKLCGIHNVNFLKLLMAGPVLFLKFKVPLTWIDSDVYVGKKWQKQWYNWTSCYSSSIWKVVLSNIICLYCIQHSLFIGCYRVHGFILKLTIQNIHLILSCTSVMKFVVLALIYGRSNLEQSLIMCLLQMTQSMPKKLERKSGDLRL